MTDAFERAAQPTENEHRSRRRRRRARLHEKGFRIHAIVFVSVQVLLVVIWALQWLLGGTAHPWFLYALAGWGVGLAIHYAAVRDQLETARGGRAPSSERE